MKWQTWVVWMGCAVATASAQAAPEASAASSPRVVRSRPAPVKGAIQDEARPAVSQARPVQPDRGDLGDIAHDWTKSDVPTAAPVLTSTKPPVVTPPVVPPAPRPVPASPVVSKSAAPVPPSRAKSTAGAVSASTPVVRQAAPAASKRVVASVSPRKASTRVTAPPARVKPIARLQDAPKAVGKRPAHVAVARGTSPVQVQKGRKGSITTASRVPARSVSGGKAPQKSAAPATVARVTKSVPAVRRQGPMPIAGKPSPHAKGPATHAVHGIPARAKTKLGVSSVQSTKAKGKTAPAASKPQKATATSRTRPAPAPSKSRLAPAPVRRPAHKGH
ncbi:MAG: hypothetical protein ACOYNB_00485 [Aquabacterium sp.]|uniref:hypothetical protein n=1 Tax=Aquabacterium sp. TaxID=1872578 RepID=UPI003BCBCCBE